MASLIARHGGEPISAPAMREVTIDRNEAALAFADRLARRAMDAIVLMTGVGTRALLDEIAPALDRAAFVAALAHVRVIARGPKPARALRELEFKDFAEVPAPNTWREVVPVTLAAVGDARGKHIDVQEHGAPSNELYEALRDAGAIVTPVPVYKWALPEDTSPLRNGIRAIVSGEATITLFTSRAQVEHMIAIAAEEGLADALRDALARGLVASIGPVCSEALLAEGIKPTFEPTFAKMGHLVKEASERAHLMGAHAR